MNHTRQRLLLASLILALLASAAVFIYLRSLERPKEAVKHTTVLVAAETIPARTLIDKSMLTSIEVEEHTIFEDYLKDSSKVIGKYTKETIMKNEGFHKDKLINEGEEELGLKLNSNHRAVSINVSMDAGVARLIKPGDFVDIVLYAAEKSDGTEIIRPDLAKTVLQNIEILAINQQLNRNEKPIEDEAEKAQSTFLVTLAVQTAELEQLVLAENIGSLKLALRPLKDTSVSEAPVVTWEELMVIKERGQEAKQDAFETKVESVSKDTFISYIIKKGDTLKQISKQFYGDSKYYKLIQETNNIKNENLITSGQTIKIPKREE